MRALGARERDDQQHQAGRRSSPRRPTGAARPRSRRSARPAPPASRRRSRAPPGRPRAAPAPAPRRAAARRTARSPCRARTTWSGTATPRCAAGGGCRRRAPRWRHGACRGSRAGSRSRNRGPAGCRCSGSREGGQSGRCLDAAHARIRRPVRRVPRRVPRYRSPESSDARASGLSDPWPDRLASCAEMGTGTRPLLMVDVDGVLSLFGFEPPAPAGVVWTNVDGLPHALSRPGGRPAGAARRHLRLRLVHRLGGARGGAAPAPARAAGRLAAPDVRGAARRVAAPLEAGRDRGGERPGAPGRVDRRRLRRDLRGVGGRAPGTGAAGADRSGDRPARRARHAAGVLGARALRVRTGSSGGRRRRSGNPAVPRPAETYRCRPCSTTWPARYRSP